LHVVFIFFGHISYRIFMRAGAMAGSRFQAVPKLGRESVASEERVSDVWPDWSMELSEEDLARGVEKNRLSIVLWEAVGAVVYSVGLVILLMAILSVLHIR
jgi:hypothetical protein